MRIEDLDDQALEAELARRKHVAIPTPVHAPDFTSLIKMAEEEVEKIAREEYMDEDFIHYVFEEVMKIIFGNDFFDWFNKVVK